MALRNFIEMRDLTGRASFKWKKKIEHALHRVMPATFVPLYDLVSFSTVPYSEAKARGAANDRAVRTLVGAGVALAVSAIAIAVLLATKAVP
jgi:kynurenine 3-monooxygenase